MNRFTQYNQSSPRRNAYQGRPIGQARQYPNPQFNQPQRPPIPIVPGDFTPATNPTNSTTQKLADFSSNTQLTSEYPPPSPAETEKEEQKVYKIIAEQLAKKRSLLPGHITLPPNEKLPFWTNRCTNCFEAGHLFSYCPLPHICLHCNRLGHVYRQCSVLFFQDPSRDPLLPVMHTNPADFPTDRIKFTQVHYAKNPAIINDLDRYTRVVVLDARLISNHSRDSIYQILNKSRNWESKIQVSYWYDQKYLLSLPFQVNAVTFSKNPPKELVNKGFMFYPWSYKEGASITPYRFRVWLDVFKPPTFIWKPFELQTMIGSFGTLEEHGPLAFLPSIEKVRIVALVEDLNDVLEFIKVKSCGITTDVFIRYVGWMEEPFTLPFEPCFVPTIEKFQELEARNKALERQKEKVWQPKDQIGGENEESVMINRAMLQQMLESANATEEIKKLLSTFNGGNDLLREKGKGAAGDVGSSSKGMEEQSLSVDDFNIQGKEDVMMENPLEPIQNDGIPN